MRLPCELSTLTVVASRPSPHDGVPVGDLIEGKVYLVRLQREISDGVTPESLRSGSR